MNHYYRITAYRSKGDFSVIIDCNGRYEKIWQFSSFLVKNGFHILEVGDGDTFGDGNLSRAESNPDKLILRACMKGRPMYGENTVTVSNKFYLPNKGV